MNKIKEYTPDEMVGKLKKYFRDQGYEVDENSKKFQPARVPLYCRQQDEEIVIDFTIDRLISKKIFFPSETIEGVEIQDASPVRFYQYYFTHAKIFFAYPYYVKEDNGFNEFKKVCENRGIGLLKIFKKNIKEVAKSRPLFDVICAELEIKENKINKLEYHLRNCLHYFVYYPKPVFKRRAITGKAKERMSYVLIDKLSNLNNIVYNKTLIELSFDYRKEARDDYEIAEKCITDLWQEYLGLKYPSIHKRVENILQRDEVYREHFVHQFQVFLIGAYILDYIYPEVAKKFEEKHECKIENVWLAASTFHDFSYGLQNFDTWLMQFFEEILRLKYNQTKDNINLLNLDAAMIREALFDQITKIIDYLCNNLKKNGKKEITRFFYEKAVRDRNHGVLSAISLLKLHEESEKKELKIKEKGILEAAVAVACHDEDIWEALCGCQGYLASSGKMPFLENDCAKKCRRGTLLRLSKKIEILKDKKIEILKDKISEGIVNIDDSRCESWERDIMKKRIISKIGIKDNPILFLLTFCDNIQDEGRVTSSDKQASSDRSTLENIDIEKKDDTTEIMINLKSDDQAKKEKKENEIERLAWCLEDDRFRISINNDTPKTMNGKGG